MQHRQEHFAAPVIHLIEDLAIASGGICWLHNIHVHLILNPPPGITRCLVQVDNHGVQRLLGVQLAICRTNEADIGARGAKGQAISKGFHAVNLQAHEHTVLPRTLQAALGL